MLNPNGDAIYSAGLTEFADLVYDIVVKNASLGKNVSKDWEKVFKALLILDALENASYLDEEDANEKVTISYFKRNLKLVVSLLDLIIELKDEKDLRNNSLDIIQDGKVALVSQISDIESQMVVLEAENLELKE